MKVLLIDDEANNGWKEVIEKVLFNGGSIDVASDLDSAKQKLDGIKFDIIFLDLRFGENDHFLSDISKFGGYNILKNKIKDSFNNINFPTPILLFTASNKAWNIIEMIEAGADDFYIKEHPETANDISFSQTNYIRLKNSLTYLLALGEKRRNIWNKINEINKNTTITNQNIKKRIDEKLRIGYGLLFRESTRLEKEKLLFNNEIVAFIVFWSILEEISKDSFKDNWIKNGDHEGEMNNNNWIFKTGELFVEDNLYFNQGIYQGTMYVGLSWNSNNKEYSAKSRNLQADNRDVNFFSGKINLSSQIYALMLIWKKWSQTYANDIFKPLNDYRNKIDFIHSSVATIFNKSLLENMDNQLAFGKCSEILDFINKLLK